MGKFILQFILVICSGPVMADSIRWGDTGSIFGGSTWEVTPDNRVVFTAYGDDAVFAERAEWVGADEGQRAGRITFLIPDAYARALAVVTAAGDPGAAPAFATDCTDAGFRNIAVDVAGLRYDISVDNCIAGSSAATGVVKRHYRRVRGVQDALFEALGLGLLFP